MFLSIILSKIYPFKAFKCNLNAKLYSNVLRHFVQPFSRSIYGQNNLNMHQDNATTHYGTAKIVLDEIGVKWVP
jgi:hypothetical protein